MFDSWLFPIRWQIEPYGVILSLWSYPPLINWMTQTITAFFCSGDLLVPPGADQQKPKSILFDSRKKNIRGGGDDSDSDDDW